MITSCHRMQVGVARKEKTLDKTKRGWNDSARVNGSTICDPPRCLRTINFRSFKVQTMPTEKFSLLPAPLDLTSPRVDVFRLHHINKNLIFRRHYPPGFTTWVGKRAHEFEVITRKTISRVTVRFDDGCVDNGLFKIARKMLTIVEGYVVGSMCSDQGIG